MRRESRWATLDDFNLPTLNDFAHTYAGLIIQKGKMNLYTEIAAKKGSVASTIEFSGKFEDPKIRTLAAIGFAFRHAFIHSLAPEIDHTIQLEKVKTRH